MDKQVQSIGGEAIILFQLNGDWCFIEETLEPRNPEGVDFTSTILLKIQVKLKNEGLKGTIERIFVLFWKKNKAFYFSGEFDNVNELKINDLQK